MLELWDIVIILGLLVVSFILFTRLMVFAMKRLIPQMVPQLMDQVKGNIPNISIKQGIGLFIWKFVESGGVEMVMQKLMGSMGMGPPKTPPRLPPGGS